MAALLSACANTPQQRTPGELPVFYSTAYSSGIKLKEAPKEVTIVHRQKTVGVTAAQVALNVFSLAMGAGAGFMSFGKEGFRGDPIGNLEDRNNLRIPVKDFTKRIGQQTKSWFNDHPEYKERQFSNGLFVAGGSTRLIYENLIGADDATYRLVLDLEVYKKKETAGWMTVTPNVSIRCDYKSAEPVPQTVWAEDSYAKVRKELADAFRTCEERVIAALPELLKE